MTNFTKTLYEIMEKQGLSASKLADMLGFKHSTFYDILRSENIMLRNALKIVDYFGSSLEYFDKQTKKFYCDYKKDYSFNFYDCVKSHLKANNISFLRMCADLKMSRTNLTRWRDGDSPKLQTVIALAKYFKVSPDKFLGRV